MLTIEILGIGCNTCRRMEAEVREIVQRLHLEAQVIRVEDLEKILLAGITVLPGLVINGQLVASGYSGRGKLERLLSEASASYIEKEKK